MREVNQIMTPPPDKIVYCYGEYQNLFSQYPNVEFSQGLPDSHNLMDANEF